MKKIFSLLPPLVALLVLTSSTKADEVVMAFPTYQPPYVLLDAEEGLHSREGIMLDIIRESLAFRGHSLLPRFVPYNRFSPELESGIVSAVAIMKGELPPVFASQASIKFINYAITRKGPEQKLNTLSDLAGRRVVTWQGADKDLGTQFADHIPTLALYREMAEQDRQVRVFVRGRADVTVLDESIFRYFARINDEDPGNFYYNDIVGGELVFATGFVSQKIRDDFDAGLTRLKESGRYHEIYNFYSNEYSQAEPD